MAFAALSVILRGLSGRDMVLPVGQEVASAQPLNAVYRLADAAQRDPNVARILAGPGDHLDELSAQAPEFHAAVLAELKVIGHRGPAEVEMRSSSYADDPELLIRMVAKSLNTPTRPETTAQRSRCGRGRWHCSPPTSFATAKSAATEWCGRSGCCATYFVSWGAGW